MRKTYMLIGLGIMIGMLLVSAVVVLAGSLEPPSGPTETGSQMYTLEQIYDRLDTGAAATKMTSFTDPGSGPAGTMHTLDDLYDLVGERAQVPKTGRKASHWPGDDGALQIGVAWPNPRFTDSSDGTVTDNLTGLIWLKNANCWGTGNWGTALSLANGLAAGQCGLTDGSSAGDWRLPNVRELHSLIHYGLDYPALPDTAGTGHWSEGDPFTGVQSESYWSSTADMNWKRLGAWRVYLRHGNVSDANKESSYYLWPVRGGQ